MRRPGRISDGRDAPDSAPKNAPLELDSYRRPEPSRGSIRKADRVGFDGL